MKYNKCEKSRGQHTRVWLLPPCLVQILTTTLWAFSSREWFFGVLLYKLTNMKLNSSQTDTVNQLIKLMIEHFAQDSSGHDWWHTERVYKMALKLADAIKPTPDKFVIALAALAHDYTDWKFEKDESEGDVKLLTLLTKLGVESEISQKVISVVHEVSYKGAGVVTPASTIESAVVQDADRLDAIGAIGIARTFAYGGFKGRPLYDPDQKPELHASFNQYQKSQGASINHFYEKLLLLKDRLHTAPARKIAIKRHRYMEKFLTTFYQEWNQQD